MDQSGQGQLGAQTTGPRKDKPEPEGHQRVRNRVGPETASDTGESETRSRRARRYL